MEDDDLTLSKEALEAMKEYLQLVNSSQNDVDIFPQEDWGLSQFWYDEKTSEILANATVKSLSECSTKRIACISCPSVYHKLTTVHPNLENVYLFEYDKRFQKKYPKGFIFYDYKYPLSIDEEFKLYFDIVIADPPFLSEECLEKFAKTIKFLTNHKVVLCTGAVMEKFAVKLLNLNVCDFEPQHERKLGNDFRCYANFDFNKHLS